MADTLDTITKLIQSPPGQVAAGGVVFGLVWKFFERVESVLNEDTKLEIAVWLLGRKKLRPTFQSWPDTFAKVFDRVFGIPQLNWRYISRVVVLAYAISFATWLVLYLGWYWPDAKIRGRDYLSPIPAIIFALRDLPNACMWVLASCSVAIAALETRLVISLMRRTDSALYWLGLMVGDLVFTVVSAFIFMKAGVICLGLLPGTPGKLYRWLAHRSMFDSIYYRFDLFVPSFFTSIWLWLYAGAGFLLKAARRFDIGFEWFNRHFDIEKKPLQSIGLVAGALLALLYWAAVIVDRILA